MEQQKKNIAPLPVAADPVHIPGLTAPVAAKQPDTAKQPDLAKATEADEAAEPDEVMEPDTDVEAVREDEDPEGEDPEDAASEGAAVVEDGPSFSASDRRASIVADRAGVRYTLDDQEADFHWDEILAVEIGQSRFGRRFLVTVHTEGSRWYPSEVVAPDKASLARWEEELDAVLDAYFEEEK
ncbi:hypothetical protein [Streptomyces apocyni]|uniref:hypothetical protein n=1 Tax=Streptomyces apocyni TaxID=2654677 RepID=UPI0012EA7A03|nr:hypothetical protein [Streptomyces apocyni]